MKCLTFEIFTHKTPNPRWGGVGWGYFLFITFLCSSWHFPDFWFFDPLKLPLRPPLVGGGFIYRFSRQFMKFTGLLKFWKEPPGVGWVKNKVIDFLDSSWHFPVFWLFDPLQFPLRPPLVGEGGFFLSIFSTIHEIYRTFEILTPNPPPPTPRGGMGKKKKFIIFWQFKLTGVLFFTP